MRIPVAPWSPRTRRRIAAAAGPAIAVLILSLLMAAPTAGATAPPIGPNQPFVGLVNGKAGIVTPAPILVACPGPIIPGETTHPLAGQTLVVGLAPTTTNVGNTGPTGTTITAFQGIPPASPAATTSGLATFHRYGVAKPLPTGITVPCSGTGDITFMPLPRVPPASRAFVVRVVFINIAV
jgi:hypothetical protein